MRNPTGCMPPDYGAIGYHWKGRGWFANLYIWRRGPWRFTWNWYRLGLGGHVETPVLSSFFSHTIADVLWGLKRRTMGD